MQAKSKAIIEYVLRVIIFLILTAFLQDKICNKIIDILQEISTIIYEKYQIFVGDDNLIPVIHTAALLFRIIDNAPIADAEFSERLIPSQKRNRLLRFQIAVLDVCRIDSQLIRCIQSIHQLIRWDVQWHLEVNWSIFSYYVKYNDSLLIVHFPTSLLHDQKRCLLDSGITGKLICSYLFSGREMPDIFIYLKSDFYIRWRQIILLIFSEIIADKQILFAANPINIRHKQISRTHGVFCLLCHNDHLSASPINAAFSSSNTGSASIMIKSYSFVFLADAAIFRYTE